MLEDDPVLPKGNKFIRNISPGGKWIELLNDVDDTPVYFQDNMINVDATFYFMEREDYSIKIYECCYPSEFKAIPFEEMGLYRKK